MIRNTVQHEQFYRTFENKYTLFQLELVSDLAYEICSCVDMAVNKILRNMGTWCSETVCFFGGGFKRLVIFVTPKHIGTWCSDTVVFSGSLK